MNAVDTYERAVDSVRDFRTNNAYEEPTNISEKFSILSLAHKVIMLF